VDEDYGYCGFGAGVLDKIQAQVFDDLDAPIRRVCSEEVPVPYNHHLEEAMMPSVEKIVEAVKEVTYR
jgi:pyruvate dehydrogenase E1 component beta subunit